MFWNKKTQAPIFPLEQHLLKAKAYIAERLIVPEKPKPAATETTEQSKDQYHVQSSPRRHLDDPPIRYSMRDLDPQTEQRDLIEKEILQKLRQQYMQWEPQQRSRYTFSSQVLTTLSHKQIDPRTFYRQAGIDRKLFSKLKTDFCYRPNRETALRCCLALHLTVGEAITLLKSAGYALSDSSSFDLAIRYCLANGIYDLSAVNMLLEALDEKVFD